jgi:hypothetical protein
VKIYGPAGESEGRLYVRLRDEVADVHISTFVPPRHPAVSPYRHPSLGNVRARLDFAQADDVVLDAFDRLAALVASGISGFPDLSHIEWGVTEARP